MRYGHNLYLLACVACITLAFAVGTPARPSAGKISSWGYIYHASKLSDAYLALTVPGFDVICVSGFRLDDTGRVRIESSGMIDKVRRIIGARRTALYPMVSFQSAAQGRRMLASGRLIAAAAGNIAAMARENGFTGVHLDFEYLPPEDAPKLAKLLAALRKSFPGTITMAVFPPVGFPVKWSGFHDLKLIAPLLDGIVIMCYDLHGAHTGPGPVTDVKWAEANIQYALRYLDAGKIWLGMPAYGYRWCGKHALVLSAREGMKIAGTSYERDPSGTVHFTRTYSGMNCVVYISDRHTRSLLKKLSLRYGLAGTAVWRLGLED